MRIFYGFLVIMVATALWFLPVTQGIYDFRTDVKEDTFYYATGSGVTVGNCTLLKEVYDADITTISIISDDATDVPTVADYHSTNRVVDITGLVESSNRTLTISYDYDALSSSSAISGFLDRVPWIWMIMIIAFAPAALAYIIFGMKR